MTKVMWFGIIQLAGILTSWVIGFYLFASVFVSTAALGPVFQYLVPVIPVTVAIQLVGIVILTMGFREFRKVDAPNFSLPSTLMLLMIVGVVIAAAGAIPLLYNLPTMIAQAPYTPGTTPSGAFASAIGTVILFALVSGLGGLLALIGIIGGQILGLWRVGTRYNETIFKIGAIFVVIPLLNVVAPVLIIVAAHQVKGRLSPRM